MLMGVHRYKLTWWCDWNCQSRILQLNTARYCAPEDCIGSARTSIGKLAAAREAKRQAERDPLAPVIAKVPTEYEQFPFASWCPSCVAFRSRPDRHERSGQSHPESVRTIRFDCLFTKSDGQSGRDGDPETITALVVVHANRKSSSSSRCLGTLK